MKWTKKHLQFLRTGYATLTGTELTRAFNARFGLAMPFSAIKSTLKRERISCGRLTGKTWGRYRVVTRDQARFIADNYKKLSRGDLLAAFNRLFGAGLLPSQLRTFITNHKIKSGRTGCFEKGLVPWNTGTKGFTHANIMSFKQGNVPANWEPLGTERLTRDGYIEIKIAERNPYTGRATRYKLKHVVLWEQAHGPVPKGHAVAFRDGEKLHCGLDNLMCVSRAELLRLNKYHYIDQLPEIKPSVLALAKLEVRAFGLIKER